MKEREEAFLALRELSRGSIGSGEGGAKELTPFTRALISGVLRWRPLLDHLITKLSGRPLERIDRDVRELLRIGLYQLFSMDVAPYAAVSETVEVAARHTGRAKGFVNAVLRNATRADLKSLVPAGDDPEEEAIRQGHPPWLYERWRRNLGPARARAVLEANQELSWPDLLVNTRMTTVDQISRVLDQRQLPFVRSPLMPDMIRLRASTGEVQDEIGRGLVYPMDEGSALVASLIEGTGRRVLDLAAAPGGKSLVATLHGHHLVSHDVSLERLQLLRGSFPRLFGSAPRLVVGDGRNSSFRERFDVVLLDAPCSATGIIRRHPEIKWRLTEERIERYGSLQRELLLAALDLTAGECIYSTCSLEPEENDRVVRDVLDQRQDFRLAPFRLSERTELAPWVERGILRLTPDSGADGFTAFRLERTRASSQESVDNPTSLS
ncbi:MAG TPA: transcription antitermination factor NusB [Thermoanaerobaculia bacterium]|nr:transcription antitermination factor NusB [Thermoanaerobaculia bacterium]